MGGGLGAIRLAGIAGDSTGAALPTGACLAPKEGIAGSLIGAGARPGWNAGALGIEDVAEWRTVGERDRRNEVAIRFKNDEQLLLSLAR